MPKPKPLKPGVGWVVVKKDATSLEFSDIAWFHGVRMGLVYGNEEDACLMFTDWPGARVVKVESREWST